MSKNTEVGLFFPEGENAARETIRQLNKLQNTGRAIENGCIVKIPYTYLLDEDTCDWFEEKFVYGSVTGCTKELNSDKESFCSIAWSLSHHYMTMDNLKERGDISSFDVTIVKYLDEDIEKDEMELAKYFHKESGGWKMNHYIEPCEFCKKQTCDLCIYRVGIDEGF